MGERVVLVKFFGADTIWCWLSWTENFPRDRIWGNLTFSEVFGFSAIRKAPESLFSVSMTLGCLRFHITLVPKCPVLEMTFHSPLCKSDNTPNARLGAVSNSDIANPKHKSGNDTALHRPQNRRWFAIREQKPEHRAWPCSASYRCMPVGWPPFVF